MHCALIVGIRFDLYLKKIVHIDAATFRKLKRLEYLSLDFNNLTSLHRDTFKGLHSLMTLRLQNKLNKLDSGTFDDNKNLKKLWLNNNQLSELQPGLFKNLNNLKYLNLLGNQIKSIQLEVFTGLVELQILELNHNKINFIDFRAFESLENLEQLRLNNNKITKLYALTFSRLYKLKELSLQENKLRRIASENSIFSGLNSMKILNLESNRIDYFNSDSLIGLLNLEQVCLNNNEVTKNQEVLKEICINNPLCTVKFKEKC